MFNKKCSIFDVAEISCSFDVLKGLRLKAKAFHQKTVYNGFLDFSSLNHSNNLAIVKQFSKISTFSKLGRMKTKSVKPPPDSAGGEEFNEIIRIGAYRLKSVRPSLSKSHFK